MARKNKPEETWIKDDALDELIDQRGLDCLAIIRSDRDTSSMACSTSSLSMGLPDQDKSSASIAHDSKRQAWVEVYLRALARHGWLGAAARIAGVSRRIVYDLERADPLFLEASNRAKEEFHELLEAVAYERALNGSDRLLEFLLKGALPSKYKEGTNVAVQVNSGPIIVDIVSGDSDSDS